MRELVGGRSRYRAGTDEVLQAIGEVDTEQLFQRDNLLIA
jgi:hypothetical protein